MNLGGRLCELSLLAAVLFLPVGCVGLYTSPHGNIELPIPAMGRGAKVQEQSEANGGSVVFHDATGLIKSIYYCRLPDDPGDAIPGEALFRRFLHEIALAGMFRKVSSDAEIMTEGPIGDGVAPDYFAVVRIPGGSTMEDIRTGKRWNSTRALLIFTRNRYLYMLGYATDRRIGDVPLETFEVKARESLNAFRSTIRFR